MVPDVTAVADLVERAERPVILAGRGAVLAHAREPLEALGERIGALYATSLVGNGLFAGNPRSLGVCGGFSSQECERAVKQADLVLAFGASLNQWTTMHGTLVAQADVVRIDDRPEAGPDLLGDAAEVAVALDAELARRGHHGEPWLEVTGKEEFDPVEADGLLDPRSLCVALDAAFPAERTVVYDGGHFHWFPTPFLSVPDADGFVPAQGFQSIGLGLGVAIGAATARPDRPVLLLSGDGGTMMSLGELDSLVSQRLRVLRGDLRRRRLRRRGPPLRPDGAADGPRRVRPARLRGRRARARRRGRDDPRHGAGRGGGGRVVGRGAAGARLQGQPDRRVRAPGRGVQGRSVSATFSR